MNGPLTPIWDAYQTAWNALKVVQRCATLSEIEEERPFRNTRFHKLPRDSCVDRLAAAGSELDDLVVLSLYAAFEARLRDHLAEQARLLRGATTPDREFAHALAEQYEEYCDQEQRMDRCTRLFAHAVGDDLVAQVGNIRAFRHWVAHGRRGEAPPSVHPSQAYRTLSTFLRAARLL